MLLAGERGLSERLSQVLLRLPKKVDIVFTSLAPKGELAVLSKRSESFRVFSQSKSLKQEEGVKRLVLEFKHLQVLVDILLMQTTVSEAFMERRLVLRGSTVLGLELTRLFELLIDLIRPSLVELWQGTNQQKIDHPSVVKKSLFALRLAGLSPRVLLK